MKITLIAITAALAAVIACAPANAQRQTMADRVSALERQLNNLQGGGSSNQLIDMTLAIDQLREEMRELRGMVEEVRFMADQLREAQREQYLNLDQRIATVEQRSQNAVAAPSPQPPAFGEPVATTNNTPALPDTSSPIVPVTRDPVNAGISTTTIDQSVAQPNTVANLAGEKEAYDLAFAALRDGRYAESARAFDQFLNRYPNGEYADNAQYWLGESYYVTGNHQIALESFERLLANYPTSNKAPDALLKLGYSQYELGDSQAAVGTLNEVKRRYPDTAVARLADVRLRTLRLEGLTP